MVALVYDKENDRLVPKGSLPPKRAYFGSGPAVISDEMLALRSMADGKYYTSKRAMERSAKDRGFETVGNEDVSKHVGKPADPTETINDDVQRAWSELGGEA